MCLLQFGCSMFVTKSTWTLRNDAHSANCPITITPKNGADTGTFTLYVGQKKNVTWEGHGESYYNFDYSPSNLVYPVYYDSTKVIQFLSK
ncbi:MAG: hypothetical protein ACI4MA_04790 [Treponema sp.]